MARTRSILFLFYFLLVLDKNIECVDYELYEYWNRSQPATLQLYEFKKEHPKPIGLLTTSSGKPVEIRETITLNSDPFSNLFHVDTLSQATRERIPERFVHAKGTGAFGYFEVTHDVSKYTKADVFNGIGKKTPIVARLSSAIPSKGGNDAYRDVKGFAIKFYTNEGNLDLMCLSFPVYFYRETNDFFFFILAFKPNPKTNLYDGTMNYDFLTKRPEMLHFFLWLMSDYGIPNGYRKMDAFAIHAFEIHNKQGEKYFAKFNLRTEQGIENLPTDVAEEISARDLDYYTRDLYNAIEEKNYPSWILEMDIMPYDRVRHLDYDPFELSRLWKIGTYKTVQIGRLVLDRNPDNFFATAEQSTFSPARLVPGIPGPVDNLFRVRRQAYRQTQMHRFGPNHHKIEVNTPLYFKNYLRDSYPPVRDNGRDAPNYYPNSFNGPIPFIEKSRPGERYDVLERNAVDLDPPAWFYNDFLNCEQRQRLVNNTIPTLLPVAPFLQRRVIRLFTLTDPDLGKRLKETLERALRNQKPPQIRVLRPSMPNRTLKYYENYERHSRHTNL